MFEIDKQQFAAFVSQLRREKGYTQKELAQQLFISDKAVSKWETGASIPDVSLLLPLAELLGVTVTELLLCRHIGQKNQMEPSEVESVVKVAIQYPKEEGPSCEKRSRIVPYAVSLLFGVLGAFLTNMLGNFPIVLPTFLVLGAVFGAYFCFFARERLPAFYDENKINYISDGWFRMNLPGISFNNQNWPAILRAGRRWSLATLALLPYLLLLLERILTVNVFLIDGIVAFIWMGGLFFFLYRAGRGHVYPQQENREVTQKDESTKE